MSGKKKLLKTVTQEAKPFTAEEAMKTPEFKAPAADKFLIRCPYCLGSGYTYGWKCPACKGNKQVDQRTFKYPEE